MSEQIEIDAQTLADEINVHGCLLLDPNYSIDSPMYAKAIESISDQKLKNMVVMEYMATYLVSKDIDMATHKLIKWPSFEHLVKQIKLDHFDQDQSVQLISNLSMSISHYFLNLEPSAATPDAKIDRLNPLLEQLPGWARLVEYHNACGDLESVSLTNKDLLKSIMYTETNYLQPPAFE